MVESTNDSANWQPVNEWIYASDALSARTVDGAVEITLKDELASPLGNDEFTPLQLSMKSAMFHACIPIQRYWYKRVRDFNYLEELLPYWRVAYQDAEVKFADEASCRASDLPRARWLILDRLLANAIAFWPAISGEAAFRKREPSAIRKREPSANKTLWGAHLSWGWEPDFVRNLTHFRSPSYFFRVESYHGTSKQLSKTRDTTSRLSKFWRGVAADGRLAVASTLNSDRLTLRGYSELPREIVSGGEKNFHLFDFSVGGEVSREVPTGYLPGFKNVAWAVDEAVLLGLEEGLSFVDAMRRSRQSRRSKNPTFEPILLDPKYDAARWAWSLRFIEAALAWPHIAAFSAAAPPAVVRFQRAPVSQGGFEPPNYSATIFPYLFEEFARFS